MTPPARVDATHPDDPATAAPASPLVDSEAVERVHASTSLVILAGIAALPVVYTLTTYLDQGAWLFAATRAVLFTAVISAAIVGFASLLLRERVRGGLVGLCLVAMLFVHQFPGVVVFLAVVAGLIALDALLRPRTYRATSNVLGLPYKAAGVFGLALLMVTLIQFGVRGQITGFAATAATTDADPRTPDIWLVLLDGYPRPDILERVWGYDDPRFRAGLEGLGFSVADEARSNYNTTKLTLPAMFNMALLQDLEPWSGYDKPADAPAGERVQALQHNLFLDLVRDHGYHTTSIGAGYTHEDIRAVDAFVDAGTADVVELHLLGLTAVGKLLQSLDPLFGEHQVGRRVEANLASLRQLSEEASSRPRFVFGHIPAPHPPLAFATVDRPTVPLLDVFDYPVDLFGDELLEQAYREHLSELNERVLETLGAIVDAVGDDGVVIVMSDHGSRTSGHEHALAPEEEDEQFSILLAARTPDGVVLYEDDAMSTDVLSTVANRYLGAQIPPVKRVFESLDGTRYLE